MRHDVAPATLPDSVSAQNWIFLREPDDFVAGVQALMQALETDIEWVHTHTRLLLRALDWDKRARDESLLLRGRDLTGAETALTSATAAHHPAPTTLQSEYVRFSRKDSDKRLRTVLAAATLTVAVIAVLSFAAWKFNQLRGVQTSIASANALTNRAQTVRDSGPDTLPLTLLLALESRRIAPSEDADKLIRETVRMMLRPAGRLPHEHSVKAVAFSPDGKLLATVGDQDANVRIWDVASREELRALRHSGDLANNISAVTFTPEGSSLVTAGFEGLTFWDVRSGVQTKRLAEGETLIALAISDDGKYLATGDHKGVVIVVELPSGRRIMQGRHGMIVNGVAWSPDGRSLASVSNDKTARVWKVPGGQTTSLPHTSGPVAVAWSPDGTTLATGGWEGLARVWDVKTGRERSRFDTKGKINAIGFTPDGTRLIAGLDDHTARVWDLSSEREVARMTHDGAVSALAVSTDGRLVATGSGDQTARLWETGGGEETMRLAHPDNIVTGVAYSPSGNRLATVSDRAVRVWEVPGGREILRLDHEGRVGSAVFGTEGRSIRTVSENPARFGEYVIDIWNAATGKRERQVPVPEWKSAFDGDGRYYATADSASGAIVRDLDGGDVVTRISKGVQGETPSAVALSADHHYLAEAVSVEIDKPVIHVWDATSGVELCQFALESDLWMIAFSPDGRRLAAGGTKDGARVWDLSGCRATAHLMPSIGVGAVAFSSGGSLLATGGRDFTARVWSIDDGKELARLSFGGVVSGVAFSSDGGSIAAASSDRTARIWRWRSDDDLIAAACARAGRNLTKDEWRRYLAGAPYHETCPAQTASATGASVAGTVTTASNAPPAVESQPADDENDDEKATDQPDKGNSFEVAAEQERRGPVEAVAVTTDGTTLAVVDTNGVAMWNLMTGRFENGILGKGQDAFAPVPGVLAFSRDGGLLAGGGHRLWIVDRRSARGARVLEPDAEVTCLAFSPDSKLLATGNDDYALILWDVASGQPVRKWKAHEETVKGVAFSPDGNVLVSGSADDTTRFWDVATGRELRRIKSGTNAGDINTVAVSPDGSVVANNAQLLDARLGTVIQTLEWAGTSAEQVTFSPQGDVLAGTSLARIVFWSGKDGRLLRKGTDLKARVLSIAFGLNGAVIAGSAAWEGAALWNAADGRLIATLLNFGDSDWAVISPDGKIDGSDVGLSALRVYRNEQPVPPEEIRQKMVQHGLLSAILQR